MPTGSAAGAIRACGRSTCFQVDVSPIACRRGSWPEMPAGVRSLKAFLPRRKNPFSLVVDEYGEF